MKGDAAKHAGRSCDVWRSGWRRRRDNSAAALSGLRAGDRRRIRRLRLVCSKDGLRRVGQYGGKRGSAFLRHLRQRAVIHDRPWINRLSFQQNPILNPLCPVLLRIENIEHVGKSRATRLRDSIQISADEVICRCRLGHNDILAFRCRIKGMAKGRLLTLWRAGKAHDRDGGPARADAGAAHHIGRLRLGRRRRLRDDAIVDAPCKKAKRGKDKASGAARWEKLPLREEAAIYVPSMVHLIFQEPSLRHPEPGRLGRNYRGKS